MKTERLFLGVRPASPTLAGLIAAQQAMLELPSLMRCSGLVRAVASGNLHLTLHFLGEAPIERRDGLLAALAAAELSGRCLQPLDRLVVFPSPRHGRVAGLGRTPAEPGLAFLVESLATIVRTLGFTPEKREYHPHVTCLRFKTPVSLAQEELSLAADVLFPVESVALYRSTLEKAGSSYEILGEYNLAPLPQSC